MAKLSLDERKKLHRALVQAFPTWDELALATALYLGEPLESISARAAMPVAVMNLIVWGESRNRIAQVVEAAREARPDNPDLAVFAESMKHRDQASLTSPAVAAALAPAVTAVEFTTADELRARAGDARAPSAGAAGEALERKVLESVQFFGTAEWRDRMATRERAVCRVEFPPQEGQGTGFLIGPDLVMTNHHVLVDFIDRGWAPDQICCRFDYQTGGNGAATQRGMPVGLAQAWLVRASRTDALDYAIVRLASPVGSEPVPGQPADTRRGWLTPASHAFETGESIFIIQHPKAAPLKVASGGLVKAEDRRVYYLANTLNGSSGSPCFTSNWDLVALHRAGDAVGNVGVPFSAILGDVPAADRSALFVPGGGH